MDPPAAAAPPPAAAPAAAPAPAPAPHALATVADVVAATHVGVKRRRAGLAPPPPAPAAAVPAPATVQPASAKKSRPKVSSRGPRGASSKAAGASPKRKKVAARKKPAAPVASRPETIAGMRYKEMAASKGKPFPFKHAWAILQTFDKWKLRDQETAPKKSAMLRMDDSEYEEKERNLGKPEGTKKGKQRVKMEGEASNLREKMEQMMKAREELTRKTLETKILITEKKKEVKLAQVEAKREEAKRKADLEERMIKVKEAKVWKELMVEEKEHMMMSKKDMDEEQLQWWKDYKEDIAERKRIFRGASSTLRGDTPMSGGGDGGVDDSNGDLLTGDDREAMESGAKMLTNNATSMMRIYAALKDAQ
ncbi:DNA mismatch repair protein Msh6-1 [Hordeum vulgare]|nr:DNA mismatch repair protein Msh6-1 [Hordeum vulgare]